MNQTTTETSIKDQLAEILSENFGCVVKDEGIDPGMITYAKVNTQQTLGSEELEGLLEIKDRWAFDSISIKRSGAGICIEFKNLEA